MTPSSFLDATQQSTRYALRTLRRAPGFTLVVVATLALGIGATTAVFSIVNGLLVRSLPYRDAERLMSVLERHKDGDLRPVSFPTFQDWQAQAAALEGVVDGMAYVRGQTASLRTEAGPEPIPVAYFTPGFVALMGIRVLRGRTFDDEEERVDVTSAVLMSYEMWQHRFAGDPSVTGKQLMLNGVATTVIGVMPRDAYPNWAALWQPLGVIQAADSSLRRRGAGADSRTVIRIAGSADSARAAAALSIVERRLAQQYPEQSDGWTSVALTPLGNELLGNIRPMLLMFMASVALVLLLCCANVANMFTVRAAGRAREIAVRSALGASRGRIALQLLSESIILSSLGGVIGSVFALLLVNVVRRTAGTRLPRIEQIDIDGTVLVFTVGISLFTALLVGGVPAIRATRANIIERLRGGLARSTGAVGERRLRNSLVVMQIAAALMLLIGAELLTKSFRKVLEVPLGFDAENLVAVRLRPPGHTYEAPADALALYERALNAVQALPGVTEAALVNHMPIGGGQVSTHVELEDTGPDRAQDDVLYRTASEDYLRAMRMRLTSGRWFGTDDIRARTPSFVINHTMAARFWPGQDAVGKRITVHRAVQGRADFGKPFTGIIIGVVADVHQFGQEAGVMPELYIPYTLDVWTSITVVARFRDSAHAIPTLRRVLQRLDPDLPLGGEGQGAAIRTASSMVSNSLGQRRFVISLLGAFSVVALLLAVLGLYAVIAYSAHQRTREFGIRSAIGAKPVDIFQLVLTEASKLAFLGVAIGVLCAVGLTRFIRGMLFATTPLDLRVYAAMSAALVIAAFAATYFPASRAAHLDPKIAMSIE
jgi:putative ABC transport system permease protein